MKFSDYKSGDIMKKKIFVILPKHCTDGSVRWLEWVEGVYEYTKYGTSWFLSEWTLRSVNPLKKEK